MAPDKKAIMGINSADMRLGSKRESDAECGRRSAAFSAVDHDPRRESLRRILKLIAAADGGGHDAGILPTLLFAQPCAQALGVQLDVCGKNVA
jgi:hypothetical protein